jgi:hypothetical protein
LRNLFYSRPNENKLIFRGGYSLVISANSFPEEGSFFKRGGRMAENRPDQDQAKGAIETETHEPPGNIGLQGQLGHRDQDPMLKDADSDFPEPGLTPEHTGEPRRKSA